MSKSYNTGFKNFQYVVHGGISTVPAPLPGAIKISFKPTTASRTLKVRLSNGTMMSTSKTIDAGKTAQLSIVDLPEGFLKSVLGYNKASDGTLYEGQQSEVHFMLLYETQGATEPTRHLLYDCVCVKPSYDATTISAKPGIDTKTLDLLISPSMKDGTTAEKVYYGKYERTVKRSDNATLYDTWFGLAVPNTQQTQE